MKQDQVIDTQDFVSRKAANDWVKEEKKKLAGSGQGVVRHTVRELLGDPRYNWTATLYIRGTK
tara:strand:+ start:6555 stop:6743 length:189 start_codon:yes stop_codon:yes gene_type:complete